MDTTKYLLEIVKELDLTPEQIDRLEKITIRERLNERTVNKSDENTAMGKEA